MTEVQVFKKNNFHFQGKLLEENDQFIVIDDRYDGKMKISQAEIDRIVYKEAREKNELRRG